MTIKTTTMNTSGKSNVSLPSYVTKVHSGLTGVISLILFGVFLYTGFPSQMDVGLHDQSNQCKRCY